MRIIHYYQMISTYNEAGEQTGTEKSLPMQVTSYNEYDFQEQLATVKGYCGDDYTVTTEPESPTSEQRFEAVEKAILELGKVIL